MVPIQYTILPFDLSFKKSLFYNNVLQCRENISNAKIHILTYKIAFNQ